MKAIWSRGGIILVSVAAVLLLLVRQNTRQQRITKGSLAPEVSPIMGGTNWSRNLPGGVFIKKGAELDDAQLAALNVTFEEKLKPVIEKWCEAYAGRLPFTPEELSLDHFHGKIGRGTSYCLYTFIIDGVTLSVEDVRGTIRVAYLNAPESKKLMQLPQGMPPDPSMPVTREEVAEMLKLDSGRDFPPAEIRMVPTAFSSAMNGGVQVTVGGDPINIASWKFTLVFGPYGKLNYYCKGPE